MVHLATKGSIKPSIDVSPMAIKIPADQCPPVTTNSTAATNVERSVIPAMDQTSRLRDVIDFGRVEWQVKIPCQSRKALRGPLLCHELLGSGNPDVSQLQQRDLPLLLGRRRGID